MRCAVCRAELADVARFCGACGAEQPRRDLPASPDDPLIGRVIADKFQIESLLAIGGMGRVYTARQLNLEKSVVIKTLHENLRSDDSVVKRFQREAKAASRLSHPNSTQVFDFGQEPDGTVFIAMECIVGLDLHALLQKEGPLPAERIGRILSQVCFALAEAHSKNVVHRDLKPENIMMEERVNQRDFIKVLDFGLAKVLDRGETGKPLTQVGVVCGTPEYMSPEQARGLELDGRADIYSIGVLAYELASGVQPFRAQSPIGVLTKHLFDPIPSLVEAFPHLHISKELDVIVTRALQKEPADRFQTAAELGEAFQKLEQMEISGRMEVALGLSRDSSRQLRVRMVTSEIAAAASKPAYSPSGFHRYLHRARLFVGMALAVLVLFIVQWLGPCGWSGSSHLPALSGREGSADQGLDSFVTTRNSGNVSAAGPTDMMGQVTAPDAPRGNAPSVPGESIPVSRVEAQTQSRIFRARKLYVAAQALVADGNIGIALNRMREARDADPEFPDATLKLALLYRLAGKPTEACETMKDFSRKWPARIDDNVRKTFADCLRP